MFNENVSIKSIMPNLHLPEIEIPIDQNLASEFYKRLTKMINEFNEKLDKENEVGLELCNFGQKITIRINSLGYWNPSLISFYGADVSSENPVQLIQHVSQINVLLIKIPRKNPEEPKRPIGFRLEEEEE